MSSFEIIRVEAANFRVTVLCGLLEVSTSGYHAHLARTASARRAAAVRTRSRARAEAERRARAARAVPPYAMTEADRQDVLIGLRPSGGINACYRFGAEGRGSTVSSRCSCTPTKRAPVLSVGAPLSTEALFSALDPG